MNQKTDWIWMDSSVENNPPGKLLSNNFRWYGDAEITEMTYRYLTPILSFGDSESDTPYMIGKRLIDGRCDTRFKNPVRANGELTVEFDFQAEYDFTEADAFIYSGYEKASLSVSSDGENFHDVCTVKAPENQNLIRLPFPEKQKGRYLRITFTGDITLFQVWIWGDAEASEAQGISGAQAMELANSIAFQSIMGAPHTSFSDVEAFKWEKRLKKSGIVKKAVFSHLPAYESITLNPILPEPKQVNAPIDVRLCRDSSAVVCLALTNTNSNAPTNIEVTVDSASLKAELFTGACMPSRWYGCAIGPLLDNKDSVISKPLLYKYTSNAPVICDFPLLHLPPAGTAVLWVRLSGDNIESGEYSVTITGGDSQVKINARVLPVTLGTPKSGMLQWGDGTVMQPLIQADRFEKEVAYRKEIGLNIYSGWPSPGSLQAVARDMDPTSKFMHTIFVGIMCEHWQHPDDSLKEEVARLVNQCLIDAEKAGLSYDRWFVSIPDEPHRENIKGFLKIAKMIKECDPNIMIYSNPAFWTGFENDAVEPDDIIDECLREDYGLIDISMPLMLNLDDRPKALHHFTTPRAYNGQYAVAAQHMDSDRSGLLSLGRVSVWDSVSRGMNLWGFYSYHQPSFESWENRFEPDVEIDGTINYQCVYAGARGPVPTRASEAVREGYDDFRIMEMLKEKAPQLHADLCREYLDGNQDFIEMRERMLKALEQ